MTEIALSVRWNVIRRFALCDLTIVAGGALLPGSPHQIVMKRPVRLGVTGIAILTGQHMIVRFSVDQLAGVTFVTPGGQGFVLAGHMALLALENAVRADQRKSRGVVIKICRWCYRFHVRRIVRLRSGVEQPGQYGDESSGHDQNCDRTGNPCRDANALSSLTEPALIHGHDSLIRMRIKKPTQTCSPG